MNVSVGDSKDALKHIETLKAIVEAAADRFSLFSNTKPDSVIWLEYIEAQLKEIEERTNPTRLHRVIVEHGDFTGFEDWGSKQTRIADAVDKAQRLGLVGSPYLKDVEAMLDIPSEA